MNKPLAAATLILLFVIFATSATLGSGNHPEAGVCPPEKPYHAICTHSMHSLEGWYGKQCYADKESAQREAEEHAKKYHHGNMRWTGINQLR